MRIVGMPFSKDSSGDTSSDLGNLVIKSILQSAFPSVQFTLFPTIISDDKKVEIQPRFIIAGAELTDLNADFAAVLRIKDQGLLVLNVTPKSPAKQSGLKSGDVIIKVDKVAVTSVKELLTQIQKTPERRIALDIVRQGKIEKHVLRW